jgi:hypothetical protein
MSPRRGSRAGLKQLLRRRASDHQYLRTNLTTLRRFVNPFGGCGGFDTRVVLSHTTNPEKLIAAAHSGASPWPWALPARRWRLPDDEVIDADEVIE